MYSELGNRVSSFRHSLEMTQRSFAEKTSLSQPYIARVERGQILPPPNKFIKIIELVPFQNISELFEIIRLYDSFLSAEDSKLLCRLFLEAGVSSPLLEMLLKSMAVYTSVDNRTFTEIDSVIDFYDYKKLVYDIVVEINECLSLYDSRNELTIFTNLIEKLGYELSFISFFPIPKNDAQTIRATLDNKLQNYFEELAANTEDEPCDYGEYLNHDYEEFEDEPDVADHYLTLREIGHAALASYDGAVPVSLKNSPIVLGKSEFSSEEYEFCFVFSELDIQGLLKKLNKNTDPLEDKFKNILNKIKKLDSSHSGANAYRFLSEALLYIDSILDNEKK